MNLKELLQNWEDQDLSAYYLACCLGIVDYDKTFDTFRESKHIYWTGNSTGNFLYQMLNKMAEIGMLEFDNEKGIYRWNNSFKKI